MQQPEPRSISIDELRRMLHDAPVWLIYVPDRAAFADGHIPGSLSLPDRTVLRSLLDGTHVVVYGEDEHAAAARHLAIDLAQAGALWFREGLAGWRRARGTIDRRDRGDA